MAVTWIWANSHGSLVFTENIRAAGFYVILSCADIHFFVPDYRNGTQIYDQEGVSPGGYSKWNGKKKEAASLHDDMDSLIQLGNTVLGKECAGRLFSVQVRKIWLLCIFCNLLFILVLN